MPPTSKLSILPVGRMLNFVEWVPFCIACPFLRPPFSFVLRPLLQRGIFGVFLAKIIGFQLKILQQRQI